MNWFYIALISPALWAVVCLFDDNLVRDVYRNAVYGAIISGVMSLSILVILPFIEITIPSWEIQLAALAAGMVFVYSYVFYFRALESEYPSVTVALWNLTSVFVPVLAYIFLDEVLNGTQYFGLFLIILASFSLSVLDVRKFKFSKALYLMMFASFLTAGTALIEKYIYLRTDFWSGFVFLSIGMGVGGFSLMVITKQGRCFIGDFNKKLKKWIWVFVISELINVAAVLVSNLAISKGPVSAVKVIEGVLPIYMLIFAVILHYFFPQYFREGKNKGALKKGLLMALMIIGLYFVHN
ncbi:MAG: EamA family transporter [bacterium]|nr:EamA family transporter [bacterium]